MYYYNCNFIVVFIGKKEETGTRLTCHKASSDVKWSSSPTLFPFSFSLSPLVVF